MLSNPTTMNTTTNDRPLPRVIAVPAAAATPLPDSGWPVALGLLGYVIAVPIAAFVSCLVFIL